MHRLDHYLGRVRLRVVLPLSIGQASLVTDCAQAKTHHGIRWQVGPTRSNCPGPVPLPARSPRGPANGLLRKMFGNKHSQMRRFDQSLNRLESYVQHFENAPPLRTEL